MLFLPEVDGCTNYTILSEADLAEGNAEPPHNKSDRSLVTGWYRFQGAAGDRMPEMPDKCLLGYRCGTQTQSDLNLFGSIS